MEIKKSEFIISAVSLDGMPEEGKSEFLLLGRSNVGKSSLINAIANRKSLARVSSNPGKTDTLNFYLLNDNFYLVDAPGYGYARVSKTKKETYGKMIEEYLLKREQIKSLIQFIDARHDIQKNDYQMREWVEAYKLPIFTIVTKIDYVSRGNHMKIVQNVKKQFGGDVLLFSATDRQYCDAVIEYLINLCKN